MSNFKRQARAATTTAAAATYKKAQDTKHTTQKHKILKPGPKTLGARRDDDRGGGGGGGDRMGGYGNRDGGDRGPPRYLLTPP